MPSYCAAMRYCLAIGVCLTLLALTGCGLLTPAKKPDIGPAGKPTELNPNPPILERFRSAPPELYDLEAIAGNIFEGVNTENWPQAETGLYNLETAWRQAKEQAGAMKGVKEADEAIGRLAPAIAGKRITASYETLNQFMACVSDIGKSYKLSPIADIISVGNGIRNVSFFAEDKNWPKASTKAKELDDTWNQVKPSLEQFGILGEVTRTHSTVRKLRDAVIAENKGAVDEHVASLNDSMGKIRDYYRGK